MSLKVAVVKAGHKGDTMKLQIGDRLLTKRIAGLPLLLSEAIAWWLHSKWSHIVPVLSETECLNITWPKPKVIPIKHFTSGDYEYKILRPIKNLTDDDKANWLITADEIRLQNYDTKSFLGFITNNSHIENSKRANCAEGTLYMDINSNIIPMCDVRLISPQSYENFATAGMFVIIA